MVFWKLVLLSENIPNLIPDSHSIIKGIARRQAFRIKLNYY
jgi:hypothetical protein